MEIVTVSNKYKNLELMKLGTLMRDDVAICIKLPECGRKCNFLIDKGLWRCTNPFLFPNTRLDPHFGTKSVKVGYFFWTRTNI